jgi:hypothetical protein
MTQEDLQLLKDRTNGTVRITCTDGEVIIAKVQLVSEEDEDVVYDLISTTKEVHYEKHDEQPAYLIKFEDISSVEPLDTRSQ